MADPIIEEDSLISQSDIDKLLESSSIEEAEDKFAEEDDLAGELGELSQDDIDNLMNSNLSAQGDSSDETDILDKLDKPGMADTDDEEMELISQDDIDQLMNSNMATKTEPAPQKGSGSALDEEDFGELSQDDIDRLMNSNSGSDEKMVPALDTDEAFEEFSKDDIKALVGAGDSKPEKESPPEDKIDSSLNFEDNDILKNEKIEEISMPVKESRKRSDDFVIKESEASDVTDCLISEVTLDELIKNFNTGPASASASDPVILDEDPPAALKSRQIPEQDAFQKPADTSADDVEDFLKPVSDVDAFELNDEREDVTQEDIDALLTESGDEEAAEDDILISQDDIDTLLMAADQEDEDVLGDILDKGLDTVPDDDLDDTGPENQASEETEEEEEGEEEETEDEEDNEDKVVLQGDDEVLVKPKKKKKKAGPAWYKKKPALALVSFLVIIGITVPLAYFFYFSDSRKAPELVNAPEKPVAVPEKPVADTHREVEIETVEAPVKQPAENKKPGNMVLKDFVILAPDISKNIAYITTDISIDYADQKAFQEIQDNPAYFRDLIYNSIKSQVVEQKENITEEGILSVVETTLKKALPANFISRVSFISFKTS